MFAYHKYGWNLCLIFHIRKIEFQVVKNKKLPYVAKNYYYHSKKFKKKSFWCEELKITIKGIKHRRKTKKNIYNPHEICILIKQRTHKMGWGNSSRKKKTKKSNMKIGQKDNSEKKKKYTNA